MRALSREAVDVVELGFERASLSLDRFQRCQSNGIKEGFGKTPTHRVEVHVVSGHNFDGKSERQTSSEFSVIHRIRAEAHVDSSSGSVKSVAGGVFIRSFSIINKCVFGS